MKNWVFIGVILILGLLQLTFLDYFRIFTLKPDLLLICVVIAALFAESRAALALSIFAGLFKDTFGTNIFGINTALFALWAFLIARLNRKISIDNNFLRMNLVFIVAFAQNTISGITLLYLGRIIPAGIFLRIVFIGSLYTALLSPLVLWASRPFIFDNYRLR